MGIINTHIHELLEQDSFLISDVKPHKWAEQNRFMGTEVSNFPGPFSYKRTPYLKEVVDCLMPDHPAKRIAVMKGAQIGFSTGVIENGIGYLMAEQPCNILLAARDDGLVKDMMDKKIDQMIDSCGLREMIGPNVVRARNQRTGDTSKGKEFPGGSIRAFSVQAPGRMRQISVQVGFLDDFEAAPADKDAGSATKLFETRFASYYDKMKIFYISTPEVKHTSNIEPLYLQGDQRRYHVPCPKCGDHIILEWKTTGRNGKRAGITYELDGEGELVDGSVGYTCQSCGDFFTEGHKYDMNLNGMWMPTVRQKDPTFFSYHISALYAPPGMYDWEHYVRNYIDCFPRDGRPKIDDYKVFINTALGDTWEERGHSPKVTRLAGNTRPYPIGIVPQELSSDEGNGQIVMLTCACDLNGTEDDARLDYEVIAWSESGASYSIDHGSIGTFIPRENTISAKKRVDRERWSYDFYQSRNVWSAFTEIINKQYHCDVPSQAFTISVVGIDTGQHTQFAYQFMESARAMGKFVIGLKGKGVTSYRKNDANTSVYQKSKERDDLYLIEVNQLKDELSGVINLKWDEEADMMQPNGFMNFPTPADNKYTMKSYFNQYESEHKILKNDTKGRELGYLWEKRNSNVMNHFWDVAVYNRAVKEILMDLICRENDIKMPNWKEYCKLITR